jgi:hypothetical protein
VWQRLRGPSLSLRVTNSSLLGCILIAVLLRLAFVFAGFPALEPRWHLREDGDGYGEIAKTIRAGQYTDVTRGPVYPVLFALVGTPVAMKIVQALLDAATCALVFWLANRRWWAAALWAVYPFAIWRVAFINKESVLAFLLAGYALVQLVAIRRDAWLYWIASGVLLALLNLCKPMFLVFPLVLLAFVPPRRWLLVCTTMLALIAPWTYRNWRVMGGEFLPVATERGGLTTFVGNFQPTLGLWEGPRKAVWLAKIEEITAAHAGASVVELDRVFYRAAWRQVSSNPVKACELFVRKLGRFWFLSAAHREEVISIAIQGAYLALLCIGLWRAWPLKRQDFFVAVVIVYVMLLHALSYADLRFSLPVMPLVCVLASKTFASRSAATGTS